MKKYLFLTAIIFLLNSLAQAGPLQELIDATPDGGVVTLSGVYDEEIVINGRDLTLTSEDATRATLVGSVPTIKVLNGSSLTLSSIDFVTTPVMQSYIDSMDSDLVLVDCTFEMPYTYELIDRNLFLLNVESGTLAIVRCSSHYKGEYSISRFLDSEKTQHITLSNSNISGNMRITGTPESTIDISKTSIYTFTAVGIESFNVADAIMLSFSAEDANSISITNSTINDTLYIKSNNDVNLNGVEGPILSIENSVSVWIEVSTLRGIILNDVEMANIVSSESIGADGLNTICGSTFIPWSTRFPDPGYHGLDATNSTVMVRNTVLRGGMGGSGFQCATFYTDDAPNGVPIVSENSTINGDIIPPSDFSRQSEWELFSFDIDNSVPITGHYNESIPAVAIRSDQANSYGTLTRTRHSELPNGLFRWKYDLSSSVNNGPNMRLRANSPRYNIAYTTLFNGKEDHLVTPKTEPAPYYLYFQESKVSEMLPSLDLLHSNPNDSPASYFLHHWQVDWRPYIQIRNSYRVESNNPDWEMIPLTENFTPPVFFKDEAGVGFTAPDGSDTFGFWTLDTGIQINPEYLYRATFKVTSSAADEAEAINLPTFRCRLNESGHRKSALVQVTSNALEEILLLPYAENRSYYAGSYTVYLEPSGVEDQTLIVSFDLLHFEESNDGNLALQLESVKIEALERID